MAQSVVRSDAKKLLRERENHLREELYAWLPINYSRDMIRAFERAARWAALEGAHAIAGCGCCSLVSLDSSITLCPDCGGELAKHPIADRACQARRDEARREALGE